MSCFPELNRIHLEPPPLLNDEAEVPLVGT